VHHPSDVGILWKVGKEGGKLDVRNHVKLTVCNHRFKGDASHNAETRGSTSALDTTKAPTGCSVEDSHHQTHCFLANDEMKTAVEPAKTTIVDWRKFSDGDKLCKQLKDIEKREHDDVAHEDWRD
jgi:hypothetical protein